MKGWRFALVAYILGIVAVAAVSYGLRFILSALLR